MNISDGVRLAVTLSGLSKREFAKECGISASSLWRYSTGQVMPTFELFGRMAEVAGVKPAELLQLNEEWG